MSRSALIEVSDLTFRYEGRARPALQGLSFRLEKGRCLLVLGPSGSGKSTLALCLDGLIPHVLEGEYEGRVAVAGLIVEDRPVHVLATRVGLVFQDPEAQFCTLTVGDEVAFGLENLCVPAEEIATRVEEALDLVGLPGFEARPLERLSGGEKQRVALASVLAMKPEVLVLDEPSANLDPRASQELFVVLRRLRRQQGQTLVLVEHRLDDVMDLVDEILVLDAEGALLCRGDPRSVLYEEGLQLRAQGVWLPRVVELAEELGKAGWELPERPLTVAEMVDCLRKTPGWGDRGVWVSAGGQATGLRRLSDGCSQPFLDARGVSFQYEGSDVEALSDVSLQVGAGEFLAVTGGNGAGKSTLATLLSGLRQAQRGSVFVMGKDIRSYRPKDLSALVGHVFQNPEHQFVSERVMDEIVLGIAPNHGRRRGRQCAGREAVESEAQEWLRRFGLAGLADQNPFTLSQGQKRRLSVAVMLARGQQGLVLDEPTFGQDRHQSARLLETLLSLSREGTTILAVTHDMELAAEHAGRVVVLCGGKLVFDGCPASLFARSELPPEWGLVQPVIGRLCLLLREAGVWGPRLPERPSPAAFALAAGSPAGRKGSLGAATEVAAPRDRAVSRAGQVQR